MWWAPKNIAVSVAAYFAAVGVGKVLIQNQPIETMFSWWSLVLVASLVAARCRGDRPRPRLNGIIAAAVILLTLVSVEQAQAQVAFPKEEDALAKFKWEQVSFPHYCRVGRLRAVNFNNLSAAEKAELARASEQEVVAAIKSRCSW